MTVSSSTDRATFAGNGVATAFSLPFRFFDNSDVVAQAIVDATGQATPLTLGIDYALAGAGQPEEAGAATGVLTTLAPVPAGVSLFVQRIIPATQPTDIVNQGRFFPEAHENVFDRLTMLIQQIAGGLSKSLRVQPSDPAPGFIPPIAQRVNKLLSFDSSGNPIAVSAVGGSATELALFLANDSDFDKGAALVGRSAQVVKSVTDLRALFKTLPSKYAEVVGYTSAGDGWGGIFYFDAADTTSVDNGMTVIVATDGGRWKLVSNNYPILPLTQIAYNITNVGFRLKLAAYNLLKNPSFYIWHDTGIAPMATSIAENANAMALAQWRMETAGTGTTITGIQRITSPEGGLRFTANFGASTGYAYVRQNVLGVRQFSNKTLTTCVDIEVDAACSINFYMLLRFNALNDAGNRPLIVDSTPLALTAGRHKIALSMTTPDVDLSAIVPNLQESLEYTVRVIGVSSSVTVRIYGASLTPGREVFAPRSTDPLRDREDADARYEAGRSALVGLSTASGQKRLYVPYRSAKYAPPGALTYADIVGNLSKVSTYDAAGARTDNVTPTVVAPMNEGFEVILSGSTAAGIGVQYVNNTYF